MYLVRGSGFNSVIKDVTNWETVIGLSAVMTRPQFVTAFFFLSLG